MNSRFMPANQVEISLREKNQVLVIFVSLIVENDVSTSAISVMCEFNDVSLKIFATFL